MTSGGSREELYWNIAKVIQNILGIAGISGHPPPVAEACFRAFPEDDQRGIPPLDSPCDRRAVFGEFPRVFIPRLGCVCAHLMRSGYGIWSASFIGRDIPLTAVTHPICLSATPSGLLPLAVSAISAPIQVRTNLPLVEARKRCTADRVFAPNFILAQPVLDSSHRG